MGIKTTIGLSIMGVIAIMIVGYLGAVLVGDALQRRDEAGEAHWFDWGAE